MIYIAEIECIPFSFYHYPKGLKRCSKVTLLKSQKTNILLEIYYKTRDTKWRVSNSPENTKWIMMNVMKGINAKAEVLAKCGTANTWP